jgi:hypothetical protein
VYHRALAHHQHQADPEREGLDREHLERDNGG